MLKKWPFPTVPISNSYKRMETKGKPPIKWWGIVRYLQTNQLSDLMVLRERINTLKNKIKEYKTYLFQ